MGLRMCVFRSHSRPLHFLPFCLKVTGPSPPHPPAPSRYRAHSRPPLPQGTMPLHAPRSLKGALTSRVMLLHESCSIWRPPFARSGYSPYSPELMLKPGMMSSRVRMLIITRCDVRSSSFWPTRPREGASAHLQGRS
jgi:hypothetical protein